MTKSIHLRMNLWRLIVRFVVLFIMSDCHIYYTMCCHICCYILCTFVYFLCLHLFVFDCIEKKLHGIQLEFKYGHILHWYPGQHDTCNQPLNGGNHVVNSLTAKVNIRYKKAAMKCPWRHYTTCPFVPSFTAQFHCRFTANSWHSLSDPCL